MPSKETQKYLKELRKSAEKQRKAEFIFRERSKRKRAKKARGLYNQGKELLFKMRTNEAYNVFLLICRTI